MRRIGPSLFSEREKRMVSIQLLAREPLVKVEGGWGRRADTEYKVKYVDGQEEEKRGKSEEDQRVCNLESTRFERGRG